MSTWAPYAAKAPTTVKPTFLSILAPPRGRGRPQRSIAARPEGIEDLDHIVKSAIDPMMRHTMYQLFCGDMCKCTKGGKEVHYFVPSRLKVNELGATNCSR